MYCESTQDRLPTDQLTCVVGCAELTIKQERLFLYPDFSMVKLYL